jgi:hypothetical protein
MANLLKYGEQLATHHTTQNSPWWRLAVFVMQTRIVLIAPDLFLSGGDGLQIGAAEPETARQHFNFCNSPPLNHSPEGRPADAKQFCRIPKAKTEKTPIEK